MRGRQLIIAIFFEISRACFPPFIPSPLSPPPAILVPDPTGNAQLTEGVCRFQWTAVQAAGGCVKFLRYSVRLKQGVAVMNQQSAKDTSVDVLIPRTTAPTPHTLEVHAVAWFGNAVSETSTVGITVIPSPPGSPQLGGPNPQLGGPSPQLGGPRPPFNPQGPGMQGPPQQCPLAPSQLGPQNPGQPLGPTVGGLGQGPTSQVTPPLQNGRPQLPPPPLQSGQQQPPPIQQAPAPVQNPAPVRVQPPTLLSPTPSRCSINAPGSYQVKFQIHQVVDYKTEFYKDRVELDRKTGPIATVNQQGRLVSTFGINIDWPPGSYDFVIAAIDQKIDQLISDYSVANILLVPPPQSGYPAPPLPAPWCQFT